MDVLEEDLEPPVPAIDFSALLGAVDPPPEVHVESPLQEAAREVPADTARWSPPAEITPQSRRREEAVVGDSPQSSAGLLGSTTAVSQGAASDSIFGAQVAEALDRLAPQVGLALQAHQIPPPEHDDPMSSVTGWVCQAGRGAGKSYGGARWLHRKMSQAGNPKRARIIAPSFGDAVASCIEGPSGIIAASNGQVVWKPSHPGGAQLQWDNGSVCYVIGTPTAREVDRLRAIGNVDYDWFEEAAANPQIAEAERQARLSRRRLGAKWIATTTPRPIATIRAWMKDPSIAVSRATPHDNKFADPLWLQMLEDTYKGTRLYRQEVLGEILEDVEGALWQIGHLDRSRVESVLDIPWTRAAVGVDPGNTTGTTGIVVVVMSEDRHLYVVEDLSMPAESSKAWAAAAVAAAKRWEAPIVAENDSGGDAIKGVLKAADHEDVISVIPARARSIGSKGVRAEPIALLWERDEPRGHMVGSHPLLEEQLVTFVPEVSPSPDRLDAMVWACTYLWTRASYNDVTLHQSQDGSNTNIMRPGVTSPWRTTTRRQKTHRVNQE